jgi:hypothetical protein
MALGKKAGKLSRRGRARPRRPSGRPRSRCRPHLRSGRLPAGRPLQLLSGLRAPARSCSAPLLMFTRVQCHGTGPRHRAGSVAGNRRSRGPDQAGSGHPMGSRRGCTAAAPGKCLWGPWHCTLQPETSRFICRILARKLISIVRQPVLIAATRCYLIQMLRWAMTCTNGCSCWSADEENSHVFFSLPWMCSAH